ncbi:hypothetical protein Z043_125511 [Scleropages formosus]|uniref:Ig-like domain-containing protein n=1 Tax=Scleropages formosus TaxID=113540 RepID=A0A0P7W2U1_SCLFO|nr:hypothetical protein Z043_125511 [Scleropages formosus]
MAAVGWTGFMLFLLVHISMGNVTKEFAVQCGVGQTLTQPCKHTMSDCSMVTWIFNSPSTSVIELISHGKVKDTQGSGRLAVGPDCSLLINNLNTEDTGWYTCRLYHNSNKFTDISRVSLSVHKNQESCDTELQEYVNG